MTRPAELAPRAAHAARLAALLTPASAAALDAVISAARERADADGAHLGLLADRQITASEAVRPGAAGPPVHGDQPVARGLETPYEDTICANVLRLDDALLIPDTRNDERVSSLPSVQSGAVGSYAGVPVRLDGAIVGVLCLWNAAPHDWSAEELAQLDESGRRVAAELAALESTSA